MIEIILIIIIIIIIISSSSSSIVSRRTGSLARACENIGERSEPRVA